MTTTDVACPLVGGSPHRRVVGVLVIAALTLLGARAAAAQPPPRLNRLFSPQELGVLEGPDRDLWQKPDQVMDALGIADGSHVADIGAGGGWFTVRLARRVGPNGLVFAEDIQREMIDAITRRMQRDGLTNIRPILGTPRDPMLPEGELDAVLIVDSYHEMTDPVALLQASSRALRPKGRIGIVEFRTSGEGPAPPSAERVAPEVVIRDAEGAGLRLLHREDFLRFQYMLVFGR